MKRNVRRAAVVVGALVAPSFLLGVQSANADLVLAPGGFTGASEATALDLNVFGNELTVGLAGVGIDGTASAAAKGVGALIPALGDNQTETSGEVKGADGQNGDATESCGPISLPEDLAPVLSLATACSSALATIAGGLPNAVATGRVATVGVNDAGLGAALEEPIGQVLDGLAPLLDPLADAGLDVDSTLRDVLAAAAAPDTNLVDIDLGPANATTGATADAVTSVSEAAGAKISVLDQPAIPGAVDLPPVLTIEVGAAKSEASIERATGNATATPDPALVRVTVAPNVWDNLPEDLRNALPLQTEPGSGVFEVNVDESIVLFEGTPLESEISVAAGKVTDIEGGKRAEASAVGLELLRTDTFQGGVKLALASTAAEAASLAPAPQEKGPELARTGGGAMPIVAIVLLGGAALGFVINRRLRLN